VPIEIRDGSELTRIADIPIVPGETPTLNYAFDITPADLVTVIITERRTLEPALGSFRESSEALQ
jgi:methylthioribose-1-phosphate isomerase